MLSEKSTAHRFGDGAGGVTPQKAELLAPVDAPLGGGGAQWPPRPDLTKRCPLQAPWGRRPPLPCAGRRRPPGRARSSPSRSPRATAGGVLPRRPPASRRPFPVASTGVPCGIVTEAEMTSASIDGMKRKAGRPDSTRPPVRIIVLMPTEAVTYRQRRAASRTGAEVAHRGPHVESASGAGAAIGLVRCRSVRGAMSFVQALKQSRRLVDHAAKATSRVQTAQTVRASLLATASVALL